MPVNSSVRYWQPLTGRPWMNGVARFHALRIGDQNFTETVLFLDDTKLKD